MSSTPSPFESINRYLDVAPAPGTAFGIDLGPRKGMLTPTDLLEITQLRQALEPMIIELLMPRANRKQLDELDALIQRHEQLAVSARAGAMFMELDKRFHVYLAELTGNARLTEIMRAVWDAQIRVGTSPALHSLTNMAVLTQDHTRIVKAVRNADCAVAKEEVLDHIDRAYQMFTAHIASIPGSGRGVNDA
ncbi:MAG: hypothetical protein DELT_00340 [Desulfovibrio sp.]